MQARGLWLLGPLLLFVFLSLSLLVSNGVRAEKVEERDVMQKISLHMREGQQKDAVIDGLSVGQKEYEAFDQMMKTMADIKALFEQDSQLNYETIQLIPTIDLSALIELLRRATAAKFELLARLVDDVTGGVSRSAIAMLDDAHTSLRGRKFTTTTTTKTGLATTSTSTTTTTTATTTTATTTATTVTTTAPAVTTPGTGAP